MTNVGGWCLTTSGAIVLVYMVDYIHLPALSSLPFLVILMLNLAPNKGLAELDHMGSFRYLPRLHQKV